MPLLAGRDSERESRAASSGERQSAASAGAGESASSSGAGQSAPPERAGKSARAGSSQAETAYLKFIEGGYEISIESVGARCMADGMDDSDKGKRELVNLTKDAHRMDDAAFKRALELWGVEPELTLNCRVFSNPWSSAHLGLSYEVQADIVAQRQAELQGMFSRVVQMLVDHVTEPEPTVLNILTWRSS